MRRALLCCCGARCGFATRRFAEGMRGFRGIDLCFALLICVNYRIEESVCSNIICLGVVVCLVAKRNDQRNRIANSRKWQLRNVLILSTNIPRFSMFLPRTWVCLRADAGPYFPLSEQRTACSGFTLLSACTPVEPW